MQAEQECREETEDWPFQSPGPQPGAYRGDESPFDTHWSPYYYLSCLVENCHRAKASSLSSWTLGLIQQQPPPPRPFLYLCEYDPPGTGESTSVHSLGSVVSFPSLINSPESGLTLCNPMDCSSPGSSVHGKNTGVGCHFLLQGIFLIQGLNPRLLH